MSQMVVVQSRDTDARLEIEPVGGDRAELKITNSLGVPIQELLLRDANNNLYAGKSLATGEAVELAPLPQSEIARFGTEWAALFQKHSPTYPEGFDPDDMQNASNFFGNRYYRRFDIDSSLPIPRTQSSILERGIARAGEADPTKMAPQTYVVIVDQAPDLPMGVRSVREEASFHVVQGRW
jgi:hypothetical protein